MLGLEWRNGDHAYNLRVYITKPYCWSAWTDPVPSYEDVARLVTEWEAKTCPTIAPR